VTPTPELPFANALPIGRVRLDRERRKIDPLGAAVSRFGSSATRSWVFLAQPSLIVACRPAPHLLQAVLVFRLIAFLMHQASRGSTLGDWSIAQRLQTFPALLPRRGIKLAHAPCLVQFHSRNYGRPERQALGGIFNGLRHIP
jgi:hypothetical protein